MDSAEAIEILENGDWWFALDVQYTIENPEDEKLHEAVDMAIAALRESVTFADHIRNMTDEELFNFLYDIAWRGEPYRITLDGLRQPWRGENNET